MGVAFEDEHVADAPLEHPEGAVADHLLVEGVLVAGGLERALRGDAHADHGLIEPEREGVLEGDDGRQPVRADIDRRDLLPAVGGVGGVGGVVHPPPREGDVVGRDRRSVVPQEVGAQPQGVHAEILADATVLERRHLGQEARYQVEVMVDLQQRFVHQEGRVVLRGHRRARLGEDHARGLLQLADDQRTAGLAFGSAVLRPGRREAEHRQAGRDQRSNPD